jgi:hypothetical protein
MIATEHGRPIRSAWHRFELTRYGGLRQPTNARPAYWGVTGVRGCSYLWFMEVTYPAVHNSHQESRLQCQAIYQLFLNR